MRCLVGRWGARAYLGRARRRSPSGLGDARPRRREGQRKGRRRKGRRLPEEVMEAATPCTRVAVGRVGRGGDVCVQRLRVRVRRHHRPAELSEARRGSVGLALDPKQGPQLPRRWRQRATLCDIKKI